MPIFRVKKLPNSEALFELSPKDQKHLTRVLRVSEGDSFEIMLPDGSKARARLELFQGQPHARLQQVLSQNSETLIPLHLGVGLLRWPRVEWLVEKITELGIASITLLTLKYCRISKQDMLSEHKLQRLKRIAEETLKQCERYRAPEISVASLEEFLSAMNSKSSLLKILLNEKTKEPKFGPQFLQRHPSNISHYAFLIGPEGGFADEESQAALKVGFENASLGKTLLRAETAALYCSSVLSSIL